MASQAGIKAGRAFILIDAVDATGAVLNNVKRKFINVGHELTNIGRGLFTKGIAGMLPLGLATKTFMDFDDAMRQVAARSQGTADEMRNLRQQALDLGESTAFTSQQVGTLMAILAQKGFKRFEIAEMTPAIVDLARAGTMGKDLFTDMTMAAELTSGTMRAFRRDSSQVNDTVDLLSTTINSSNFTLEDLIVSLQYAGPAAEEFHVSLEDTLASLAALRDLNIDASIVGTAFRNMMTYMSKAKDRDRFNEQLREATGNTIEFIDANKNLHNLPDILMAMGKAMEGLGTADIGDMMHDLFGTRAEIPAMALGHAAGRFKEIRSYLMQAGGAAKKTHDIMEQGAGGAWREMESVIERVGIAIGNAFEKPLVKALKLLQDFGRSATAFIDDNQGLVTILGSLTVGAVILGAAIFTIGSFILFVTPIFTALSTVTYFLSVSLYLLFSAIVALPGLIVGFALTVWGLGASFIALTVSTYNAVVAMVMFTVSVIGNAITAVSSLAGVILGELVAALSVLAGALIAGTFTGVIPAAGMVLLIVGGIVAGVALIAMLFKKLPELIRYVGDQLQRFWRIIKGVVGVVGDELQQDFEELGQFLYGKATEIGDTFALMYRAIVAGVQSGELEMAWEAAVLGMKIVWLQLMDTIMDAWEALPQKIMVIWMRLGINMQKAIQAAKTEAILSLMPDAVANQFREKMGIPTWEQRLNQWLAGDGGAANKEREATIEELQEELKAYVDTLEKLAEASKGHGEVDRLLNPNMFKPEFADLIKGGAEIGPALANEALYQGSHEAVKAAAQNFVNADKGQIDRLNSIAEHLRAIRIQNEKLRAIDEDLQVIIALESKAV